MWRRGESNPLKQGLRQLDAYLQRLGLYQGTLVILDRRDETVPIAELTSFAEDRTPSGRTVTLLRA